MSLLSTVYCVGKKPVSAKMRQAADAPTISDQVGQLIGVNTVGVARKLSLLSSLPLNSPQRDRGRRERCLPLEVKQTWRRGVVGASQHFVPSDDVSRLYLTGQIPAVTMRLPIDCEMASVLGGSWNWIVVGRASNQQEQTSRSSWAISFTQNPFTSIQRVSLIKKRALAC